MDCLFSGHACSHAASFKWRKSSRNDRLQKKIATQSAINRFHVGQWNQSRHLPRFAIRHGCLCRLAEENDALPWQKCEWVWLLKWWGEAGKRGKLRKLTDQLGTVTHLCKVIFMHFLKKEHYLGWTDLLSPVEPVKSVAPSEQRREATSLQFSLFFGC